MAGLRPRGYDTDPLVFAGSVESDPTCKPDFLRTRLASQPLDSGSIVIGAFAPDLVGMLGLVREKPGKFVHKARLWGFYVEPGSQRTGAGRSLIKEAGVACETAIAAYERLKGGSGWRASHSAIGPRASFIGFR